jgi:hypothetical protein
LRITDVNGKVIVETFTSELLRHPWATADPAHSLSTCLPYDGSATRSPVIYLLTGFTGRGTIL